MRYIKLGPNNAWAQSSFDNGWIAFGHAGIPHDKAVAGDWDAVRASWGDALSSNKKSDFLREVKEFYTQGSDCLWITFAHGQMYWAFAEPDVSLIENASDDIGCRYRQVIGQWRSSDRFGKPLMLNDISTKLTKTSAYRQTLCGVAAADYAVRLINGEDDPAVVRSKAARSAFIKTLSPIIQSLHETDFEVLTDLLFTRLGWVRVSSIGGTQKDTDLILEQPATKVRALVQVKSAADQTVLDDYTKRFNDMPAQTGFFICHAPRGQLVGNEHMHVWSGADLADRVMQAGLVDWVFDRAG